jgi:hypothetical protein
MPGTARVLGGHLIRSPAGDIGGARYERTVEAWFDTIADEIEGADYLTVEFDPELGHPSASFVDYDLTTVDDERSVSLTGLEAIDDPLERWFTVDWPCGRSFQASTPDQTAAVYFQFDVFDALPVEPGAYEIGDLVQTTLVFGTDLFAHWCEDASATDPPVPVTSRAWMITGATIAVAFGPDGDATATIDDVVVDDNGKQIELGETVVVNASWDELASVLDPF